MKTLLKNRELSAFLAILALFAVLVALNPAYFSLQTLGMIFASSQILILLAVGAALVMLTRNIDVSVGSIVGLSAIAVGVALNSGYSLPVSMNIGFESRHRLLAALPGGAYFIQIRPGNVLHGAESLVAVEGYFVIAGGELCRFQAGLGGNDLRVKLLIRQAGLLQRNLGCFDFIAKRRRVEFKQQIALLHLAIIVDVYRRHVTRDAGRHRCHHPHYGGVWRQRDPDIRYDEIDEHQQERGNTYPYPTGKFLFRSHYFSVLLSSSRIVRKLQAI
jgi:hypothetical protein